MSLELQPGKAVVGEGDTYPILVATSRKASSTPRVRYGSERTARLSYDSFRVWVPSQRPPGALIPQSPSVDASKEFSILAASKLPAERFKAAVNQRLRKSSTDMIFLFIHGYNVNYATGIYRQAQIMADYRIDAVGVHYSWPSLSRAFGYAYDRDSAHIARDGLAALMSQLAQTQAKSIFVMGHSMGALLTIEAMRQLSLSGKDRVVNRISPLILASPDIDFELFVSQMNKIRVKPDPFIVMVARDDRVLQAAESMRFGHDQLDEGGDISAMQELGLVVIDLTGIERRARGRHSAFASSPTLIRLIQKAAEMPTLEDGSSGFDLKALIRETPGIVYLPTKPINP